MTSHEMMHRSEAAVSVELQTPDMTLNIGPQHPSTHGVLRLIANLDGERIRDVEPVIGYMHRGYEKLSEVRTYLQITALVNRIDWVSGFANEVPFILGVEKLLGVEVPERAQWIRLILSELPDGPSYRSAACELMNRFGLDHEIVSVGPVRTIDTSPSGLPPVIVR